MKLLSSIKRVCVVGAPSGRGGGEIGCTGAEGREELEGEGEIEAGIFTSAFKFLGVIAMGVGPSAEGLGGFEIAAEGDGEGWGERRIGGAGSMETSDLVGEG